MNNSWISKITDKLYQPVDIAFLVYFRILAGSLLAIEYVGYLLKIDEYVQTEVGFSYLFFSWLKIWSVSGLYLHISIIIVLAVAVAIGFYYRVATVLLLIAQTWLLLLDSSLYQNHIYLYCLVNLLLIFLPAQRAFSYDASRNPAIQLSQVPAWVWYILLFQISVVYFYAGVAKLYGDWIQGRPMVIWMYYREGYPVIGKILGLEWFPYVASYIALMVDLTAVPLLLFRKTRIYGFIMVTIFHLTNVAVFGLATFPWFVIMMTSLFFPPSWPRKLLGNRLPTLTVAPLNIHRSFKLESLLAIYVIVQLLLPLRHWLYPMPVAWTDEGDKFAWRMVIRNKAGDLYYHITDEHENLIAYDYADRLRYYQHYVLLGNPDLILQYAHYLANHYQDSLGYEVKVFAHTDISLNGWASQPLVDPNVDLSQEKRSLGHYNWIVPWKKVSPLANTD